MNDPKRAQGEIQNGEPSKQRAASGQIGNLIERGGEDWDGMKQTNGITCVQCTQYLESKPAPSSTSSPPPQRLGAALIIFHRWTWASLEASPWTLLPVTHPPPLRVHPLLYMGKGGRVVIVILPASRESPRSCRPPTSPRDIQAVAINEAWNPPIYDVADYPIHPRDEGDTYKEIDGAQTSACAPSRLSYHYCLTLFFFSIFFSSFSSSLLITNLESVDPHPTNVFR